MKEITMFRLEDTSGERFGQAEQRLENHIKHFSHSHTKEQKPTTPEHRESKRASIVAIIVVTKLIFFLYWLSHAP